MAEPFTWVDGERVIRFGRGSVAEATTLLAEHGFGGFALLTTERARASAPEVVAAAAVELLVPSGEVPDAAAAVRAGVGGRPLVALGGGRVIDAAKGIAGADGLSCAAIPTTLSGAEITRIHRMPAGADEFTLVRPRLVVADPALMASQPLPALAASAMNALAHALEALYVPLRNPVADIAALEAAERIGRGLGADQPDRDSLALGSLLGAYALGATGYAVHHVVCQTLVRVAGTPHAETNAVMLPHTLALMEKRVPSVVARFRARLGADLGDLAARSGGPRTLADLGVGEEHVGAVVEGALARPQLANTPDPPGRDELLAYVRAAL
ncbi:MAG: iron-containing alcohol dehydrogenase [Thermoleophilaceae bacterium]